MPDSAFPDKLVRAKVPLGRGFNTRHQLVRAGGDSGDTRSVFMIIQLLYMHYGAPHGGGGRKGGEGGCQGNTPPPSCLPSLAQEQACECCVCRHALACADACVCGCIYIIYVYIYIYTYLYVYVIIYIHVSLLGTSAST